MSGAQAVGWVAVGLVAALTTLSAACAAPEPTNAQLGAILDQHRGLLDELRSMFEEDAKRHHLRSVATLDSRCGERGERQSCLEQVRWQEYWTRLRTAGIESIETHETPGIYFHVHRALPPPPFGWSGPYRYRGLVYAPGFAKVVHTHDDTEERVNLGAGWYAYLIIDH